MKKIAFFDTKPYDKESFERQNNGRYDIRYFETRLTAAALPLADGCDAACAFVTHEALANIATTTLKNLDDYFAGAPLENEICYRCLGSGGANKSDCPRRANGRCHSVA